jgi:co-chaperonin GroES (HSP10)
MKALNDYVIVIEDSRKKENKTAGGIIMTTEVETGHKPALILGVGPNVYSVKPGQRCFLKWNEAMPFTDEDQKMAAVKEEAIFAVFD